MACLIGLLTHTSYSSPCSRMTTSELVEAATWFPDKITTDAELVAALKQGNYRAINRKRQTT